MGLRNANAALKRVIKAAEKRKKEQLKARTSYDWLTVMHDEFVKRYNLPEDFVLEENSVVMKKNALDFSIIYQSENTRLMNPVARKEIKSWLKEIEKKLELD